MHCPGPRLPDFDEELDLAKKNDHDAQYRLSKHYGKQDKKASRYWMSRAVLGNQPDAVEAHLLKTQNLSKKFVRNAASISLTTFAFVAGASILCALAILPIAGLAIAAAAVSIALPLFAYTSWKHSSDSSKSGQGLDAQACADHAAVKLRHTNDLAEILERSIEYGEDPGPNAKSALLDRLLSVPENRPILEYAACLLKDGLIREIKISADKAAVAEGTFGFFDWRTRKIWVHQEAPPVDLDYLYRSVMHEITHAVEDSLHGNACKSYPNPKEKRNLQRQLKASRAGEARALTERRLKIAATMNQPYTQDNYDHERSYKKERRVRVAELLVEDYRAKQVFEEDYSLEWAAHLALGKQCKEQVNEYEKRNGKLVRLPPSTNPPREGSRRHINAKHLARSVLNLSVANVFGDIRGRQHGAKLKPGIQRLESIFRKHGLPQALPANQTAAFRDALAQFCEPCFSRASIFQSRRRQYNFEKIDEKSLEAEILRLARKTTRTRKPAPVRMKGTDIARQDSSPRAVTSAEDLTAHAKPNLPSSGQAPQESSGTSKPHAVTTIMELDEAEF